MDESTDTTAEYFKQSANHQFKNNKILLERIQFKDADHIFELGCGTGAMSAYLAREVVPNGQVTACDPEENRIRFAKENFAEISNLNFILGTGAVALDNKENVYDVVLSNYVLHWMKDDELEKTLDKVFSALKPGGIASHNFVDDLPNTYKVLGKLNESMLKRLSDILRPIKMEKFAELARKVGFIVLDSKKATYVTELEIKDLLKLIDASTYGLFGWEEIYHDAIEKGKTVEYDMSETGKVKHDSSLVHFILKKP